MVFLYSAAVLEGRTGLALGEVSKRFAVATRPAVVLEDAAREQRRLHKPESALPSSAPRTESAADGVAQNL